MVVLQARVAEHPHPATLPLGVKGAEADFRPGEGEFQARDGMTFDTAKWFPPPCPDQITHGQ